MSGDRTVTTTLVARVNQHIAGMNSAAQANRNFGQSAAQASMVHDKAMKGAVATTDNLASRSRVAFRGLSQLGGQSGMFSPLTGSLAAASEAFALMEEHGKSTGTVLMGTGAAATAAGLLMVQASAADVQQHALLKTAVEASGHSYEEYAKRVESTVGTQERFGHTVSDTENAIRNLTQATGDPTKAMDRMGLVADLAASRHTSLADASNLVTRVLAGKGGRTLAQYGIVMEHTKDKTKAGADAADQLARKLSGQASAAADTFTGKMDAAKTRVEDFANSIGAKVGPVLTTVGPLMAGVGAIAQVMGARGSRAAAALAASQADVAASAAVAGEAEVALAAETDVAAVAATRATAANEALGASSVATGGKMAGLAKNAGLIGVAAVAAGAAVAGLSKLQDSTVKYSQGTDKMTQSLLTLNRTGQVTGDVARVFGGNLNQLASDLKRLDNPTGYQHFNDKMNSIFTLGKYKDTTLREAIADYKALDASVTQMVTSGHADQAAKALTMLGVSTATAAKHLPNYTAALDQMKTASMLLDPALQGNQTWLQKVTGALDQYATAMYGASTAAGAAETANLDWLNTLAKAPAALKDNLKWLRAHHRALDDTTQAGRDVSTTLVDLSGKAVANAVAISKQTGQTRSGVLAFAAEKLALERSLKAHGELTPAMQALINRYFVVNPLTLAAAAASQAHADKVKGLAAEVAKLTPKTVQVNQTGAEAATAQVLALERQMQLLSGAKVTISATGQAIIPTGMYAGKHLLFAAGGEVPMLPGAVSGRDSVAAMLTPREYIIREDGSNLADAFAHFAKGFAAGGLVEQPRRMARGGAVSGGNVSVAGMAAPSIVIQMGSTTMSESALTHAVRLAHQRSRVGLPR